MGSGEIIIMVVGGVIFVTALLALLISVIVMYRRRQLLFEHELVKSKMEIQEQTLRSISEEIHDNIGQVLSLVSLNLNTIATQDKEKVKTTSDLLHKAIQDLRNLSKSLNPERIQQVGLLASIKSDLQFLQGTGKYSCSLEVDENFPDFDSNNTVIIFRIMQEVINNIIKHADASAITVNMKVKEDKPVISITDNGKGFRPGEPGTNGIGLQNIKHRALLVKATAETTSLPGAGTTVSLVFAKLEPGSYAAGR